MLTINNTNFTAQIPTTTDFKNKIPHNTTTFNGKLAPLKMDSVSFKAIAGKVINTTGDVNITKKDGLIKSIYTTGNVSLSDGAYVSGDVIAKGIICIHDGPVDPGKARKKFFEECDGLSKRDNVNQLTTVGGNVQSIDKSVYISGQGTIIEKDVSSKSFVGVGSGAIIEGNVHSEENSVGLFNKGTIVKKDVSGCDVNLFAGAVVEGNVKATESAVVVKGEGSLIKGDVDAIDIVLIEDGAKVLGKITSKYLNGKDN